MTDRARDLSAARVDFLTALDGLDLTPSEQRVVDWLLDWDQPTLNALADIIRKARAESAPPVNLPDRLRRVPHSGTIDA